MVFETISPGVIALLLFLLLLSRRGSSFKRLPGVLTAIASVAAMVAW